MKPAEGSTVIGRSVTIRGELTGNEDLFMDGDIEGTITLPGSRLTIGPNARVLADVHGLDIIVFGAVSGNIHAAGRLELRQSASVIGDIFAGRLSIEEIARETGFGDRERMRRSFLRTFGQTPQAIRNASHPLVTI